MANEARFIGADRVQTRWDLIDLEGFLPSNHRARILAVAMTDRRNDAGLAAPMAPRVAQLPIPKPARVRPPPNPRQTIARNSRAPRKAISFTRACAEMTGESANASAGSLQLTRSSSGSRCRPRRWC